MANNSEKALYFLIGGFVGAAVALLFAPKSGEETRRLIGEKYRSGADEVGRKVKAGREYVTEARQGIAEKVSSSLERGREAVGRHKDQLSSAIDAGRKAYYEEKGKIEQAEETGESA